MISSDTNPHKHDILTPHFQLFTLLQHVSVVPFDLRHVEIAST